MSVKMDTARALGLMGFTSTRWMDASTGADPKAALDKALFDQTQNLSLKRTTKGVTKFAESLFCKVEGPIQSTFSHLKIVLQTGLKLLYFSQYLVIILRLKCL